MYLYVIIIVFRVLPSKYALSFLLIAVTMALIFLARNVSFHKLKIEKTFPYEICFV